MECRTDSSHFCKTVIINGLSEDALIQPLVQPTRDEYEDDDGDKESSEDSEETKKPAKSVLEALKLLTTPVKVCKFTHRNFVKQLIDTSSRT